MPSAFLRFDAAMLAPPWPAAIALVVVLGVLWLGLQTARRLGGAHGSVALNTVAGFVLVAAMVAAVVQTLALLGAATTNVLRIIGGGLAVASLGLLGPTSRARAKESLHVVRACVAEATALQRWVLVASGVTFVALGIVANVSKTRAVF